MMDAGDAYNLMHEGVQELAIVEANGIRIDEEYLASTMTSTQAQIEKMEKRLQKSKVCKVWNRKYGARTNYGSRMQLGSVLFEEMGYECTERTATGRPKTDIKAFEKLDIPFVKNYLRIEKLKKARNTYLKGIQRETVNGFCHPVFDLHLVRTYRSSSNSPNFQNMPIRDPEIGELIRRCFIPREGNHLVEIDYGGIEVKVAACVTGDTKIETIDGPQSIKTIISRLEKEDVFVFGYNRKKKRITAAKVLEGGITKKNAVIWNVVLDNGQEIKATSKHKFLLRNGKYKSLVNLMPGDSLMPFYKEHKKSHWGTVYTKIYLNNGENILAHNLVAQDVLGTTIKGSRLVVHHKDGNGTNNSLSNIEIMSRKKHMKIHSIQGWKQKGKGNRFNWHHSKAGSEHAKKLNKIRKEIWTKEEWEEFGNRISEGIRRKGGRKGDLNSMYGKIQSDETKQKISQAKKGIPTGRSWNKGKTKITDKRIAKMSELLKGKIAWNKDKKLPPLTDECKHKISLEEYKETYNHKVVSIKRIGREDVYNITVKGIHNYALSAGVIIKNCYHKDPVMLEYINDPTKDMHRDMAAECFMCRPDQVGKVERYCGKNMFVFPQFYGSFWRECAENLWDAMNHMKLMVDMIPMKEHLHRQGITELGSAWSNYDDERGRTQQRQGSGSGRIEAVSGYYKHISDVETVFWKKRFKKYAEWKRQWYDDYVSRGSFNTLTGFTIEGSYKRNEVINYPVQGSAFHCLLWSLIRLNKTLRKRKMKSMIVGQVHDSVVADVPADELKTYLKLAEKIMVHDIRKAWPWIIVPFEIEAEITPIDKSWFEKKAVKI